MTIAGFGETAFNASLTPAVTSGAYVANDIMGGLLSFPVGRLPTSPVLITGGMVVCKAAVAPALKLMLFNADPTSTTKTDNAAYSLNAADAFKLIGVIDFGATWIDHGTPNSVSVTGLQIVGTPTASIVYGLLIDGTGVTLTSTSDIQVTLSGAGS